MTPHRAARVAALALVLTLVTATSTVGQQQSQRMRIRLAPVETRPDQYAVVLHYIGPGPIRIREGVSVLCVLPTGTVGLVAPPKAWRVHHDCIAPNCLYESYIMFEVQMATLTMLARASSLRLIVLLLENRTLQATLTDAQLQPLRTFVAKRLDRPPLPRRVVGP